MLAYLNQNILCEWFRVSSFTVYCLSNFPPLLPSPTASVHPLFLPLSPFYSLLSMIQLGPRGLGSAVSSRSESGAGRSAANKRFLENLEHKIKHLKTTILGEFLISELSKVCINWSTSTEEHIKLFFVIIYWGWTLQLPLNTAVTWLQTTITYSIHELNLLPPGNIISLVVCKMSLYRSRNAGQLTRI